MDGFINLDKPEGPTSHDMVAKVRKRLNVRRVGHAGTLDPMATGVLVIAVGKATRLLQFVGEGKKEYVASLLLGRETDSEDTTGQTLRESDAGLVTREQLEAAAARLRGPIFQTPPMVSAIRQGGKRLYELAREGKTVERPARPVTIYSLDIEEFYPGVQARATLRVICSGGTYIRTLCADIGRFLGCGGCMGALRRTAVGSFRVGESRCLDDVMEMGERALAPPRTAVLQYPALVLSEEETMWTIQGRRIERASRETGVQELSLTRGAAIRLETADQELVAMAHTLELDGGRLQFQPFLVLGSG